MRTAKRESYKVKQQEARDSQKPRPTAGYTHNPLPNRATRRAHARMRNREMWQEANGQWSDQNKQTVKKRTSLKDAKITYDDGGSDGNKKAS